MGANVNTLRSLEGHLVQALERVRSLYPESRPVPREPRGADQKATLDVTRSMLSIGPLTLDELAKRVAATRVKTEEKDRRFTNAKRALDALIRDGFLFLKDEKVYLEEQPSAAVSPAEFDAQLEKP